MLRKSSCLRFCKTIKQLNAAFSPIESHLFTVDAMLSSRAYYLKTANAVARHAYELNQLAEQISNVCLMLGEYPQVRYKLTEANQLIAQLIKDKLDLLKRDNPNIGQGPHKDRSIILLLDRGFDPISPLLHELTFQAMAFDLFEVDEYTYT
ncbi:unnamed protein product [Protopolystoma xenopodis]|uniref:Uncharacterized protein n=1 Tax=Protopolystoma xenopodis TaxID=117903 RepID=A0A448X254_9PLAT|nr:unnamed protein product [Protopolystoma xenopodis]